MEFVGVDIETKNIVQGSKHSELDILCASVVDSRGKVYFAEQWQVDASPKKLSRVLKELGGTYDIAFHNGSFDVAILRANGVVLPMNMPGEPKWHDTMCMSYCLYPSEMGNHALGELAELVNMEKSPKPSFSSYSEEMGKYNVQDSRVTATLAEYFLPLLQETQHLYDYYLEIELPYIELIIAMEMCGIMIDVEQMRAKKVQYEQFIEETHQDIVLMTGSTPGKTIQYKTRTFSHYAQEEIKKRDGTVKTVRTPYYVGKHGDNYDRCEINFLNTNSTQQVVEALKAQGWKPTVFTPSGAAKCDSKTLESLADKYPLAKLICESNKYSSMLSKFFKPMEDYQRDGRVYGSLNQFHTRTRRLSSSEPNLQNIPGRDERGADIRRMFVAPPGYKIVVGDLDRIEVVVLAYYLEELFGASTYANAIRDKVDVHDINSKNWGVQRKPAKNGLFCFIYGGGRDKLAATLGIEKSKAAAIIETMQDTTPELFDLRDFMKEELVTNNGIAYDLFGGCIYVPEVMSSNHKIYASGLRKGPNYLIQGTAGSIFKHLQLRAMEWLLNDRLLCIEGVTDNISQQRVYQSLVVHDEAIYYVKEDIADEVAELLTKAYTTDTLLETAEGGIPVSATFHAADNWYDAKGE